uniref:Integrase core domain-containing protein n=1 Tax=Oryzias latipes TaxID=8090 RepID=A0A3P9JR73_ORYLA
MDADRGHLHSLIKVYFSMGLNHREILLSLSTVDGIIISLRTLRRILSTLRLHRRKNQSDVLDIALFLIGQLQTYGQLNGYKLQHLRCIQEGFVVTQNTVRQLIKILDPRGVELRQRNRLRRRLYCNPGPNFIWHVDSYDKLKPYGICLNGAVDGFSRMVIWLHAYSTNSNPKIIAGYFISEVEKRGGTAARVRTDMGTENGTMEDIQRFLRLDHDDSYARNCFILGSSTHNQRIESWWAFLRKHHAQYWINVFQKLKDSDDFTGDFLDKQLILFTCLKIIEEELQNVVHLWNTHIIRQSRNAIAPSGRPCMMYTLPQLFGGQDYLKQVSEQAVATCKAHCLQRGPDTCDETVFSLSCLLMAENFLHAPTTPNEAIELYLFLRASIRSNLSAV